MKQSKDEFDWFKWAGINHTSYDLLADEAQKMNIPIFESDKEEDIFNRIVVVKSYENNKSAVFTNKILTSVTIISTIIAVISAI